MASTTTNYQLPFPTDFDPVDVSGDIALLAEDIDQKLENIVLGVIDSTVTDNTATGISVDFNSISEKINFIVDPVYIKDNVATMFDHEDHIGINAVYDTVNKQINLEVTSGGSGGGTGSSSLSDIWWLGV
jgi:hypothetical protein